MIITIALPSPNVAIPLKNSSDEGVLTGPSASTDETKWLYNPKAVDSKVLLPESWYPAKAFASACSVCFR